MNECQMSAHQFCLKIYKTVFFKNHHISEKLKKSTGHCNVTFSPVYNFIQKYEFLILKCTLMHILKSPH